MDIEQLHAEIYYQFAYTIALLEQGKKLSKKDISDISDKIYEILVSRVELPVILPERNSFGQWISVKDKLPELDETVLCYSKVKDIDGDIYNVTSLGSRFINYTQKPVFLAESGRFAETIEIIKWMPLPKP